MDNLQPYKISLDFYIRKIITVNAKQLDDKSRVINITCTENGKKFFVDASTLSAFVRYKKSDGYAVLKQIDILSDGTVNLELLQQMLAVEGRHLVDIMLINKSELEVYTSSISVKDDDNGNVTVIEKQTTNVSDLNVEEILKAITENGISVLSTMSFYINTEGITIDGSEIESSYEYDALIDGLGKMVAVDQRLVQVESNANEAIQKCNTATTNANKATNEANKATNEANTATNEANKAASSANSAATSANDAGDKCEKIVKKYETLDFEKIDEILDYKVEITQAEYNALSDEEKNNGKIYFITDVNEGGTASEIFYNNSKSGLTSANVQNVIDEVNEKKLEKNSVVNNLTTNEDGYALDARQGKILDDKITELNGNLEQSTEGRFVLPNGLKICWGITTPTHVSEYACQELVIFPVEFINTPKIVVTKILKDDSYSNGSIDLSVQCSARTINTKNFVAVMQSASGWFASDNYKAFGLSWIAIGY